MADWKKNAVHTLEITGYTAEGMGVARLEGRVVFVPGTIRGETWQVQLLKVKTAVAWGRGVKLLLPSPERREPDCPLAGRCGGCQFRHMSYREELEAKGQRVQDALARVGGVSLALPPVLGAEDPLRYRNKVQFPVAREKRGLAVGYYRARSWTWRTACFSRSPSPPCAGPSRGGWSAFRCPPMTRRAAPV